MPVVVKQFSFLLYVEHCNSRWHVQSLFQLTILHQTVQFQICMSKAKLSIRFFQTRIFKTVVRSSSCTVRWSNLARSRSVNEHRSIRFVPGRRQYINQCTDVAWCLWWHPPHTIAVGRHLLINGSYMICFFLSLPLSLFLQMRLTFSPYIICRFAFKLATMSASCGVRGSLRRKTT